MSKHATPVTRRVGSSPTQICTIGYGGKTLERFLQILSAARVERVVDVRELPLSRKKGFSKTALAAALGAAGIEYLHLRSAGNPFRAQKADIETCLGLYRQHVDAHPEVLVQLEDAVHGRTAALLCFEEHAHECHRSVIVDRMLVASPERRVQHL